MPRASACASHNSTAGGTLLLLLEKVWPHVASEPSPIPLVTGDVESKVALLIGLEWHTIRNRGQFLAETDIVDANRWKTCKT